MGKSLKLIKPLAKTGGKVLGKVAKKSDWLMMVLALLGLTGTAAMAVKATITAVKLCEEKQIQGKKEVIRTTWRLYIPAIGCFVVTTLSVIGLGWQSIKRARELATVTGLYAMSQTDLKEIRNKAKEVLGEKKEQEKIEDEVAKDRLEKAVRENQDNIIETGHGDKLFMEGLTGQLIRTSPEYVESVSENIDNQIGKEIDGVVEVSYYLSKFRLSTDCWVARAIWDSVEMRERGYSKFTIDCREIQWMEVNGKQEMVGIIRPPEPTGT